MLGSKTHFNLSYKFGKGYRSVKPVNEFFKRKHNYEKFSLLIEMG